MFGEHTGIKCKITSIQDYFTEEELDEEDNPVQLNMEEAELSEQEWTKTVKGESEMPPGEAQNLEWMVNTYPSTENIVGHARSEDLSMKENLNWATTDHYLSDYSLMTAVNLVNPNEPKMFVEAWHHPDPMQWENWQKAIRKEFPP